MKKSKYSLSKSGFEELMEKLELVAQEKMVPEVSGLPESSITTNFVKIMTKVKGLEDVIERNEQLSKTYQGFLNMYGFDTMYDMYIYAKSCDLLPEEMIKSGSRKEHVIPVSKVITRNGEPLEVTVWEIIEKAEPKKATPKKEEEVIIPHARELHGILHGSDDVANTSNVAKLKAAAEKMPNGDKPFSDKSKHYLSLKGPSGRPAAIVGYSEQGEYYKMDFFRTNGKVSGVAARGFFELVRLAHQHGKGVIAEDNKGARSVYIQMGMTKEGSTWCVSYDELKEAYGESGKDSE